MEGEKKIPGFSSLADIEKKKKILQVMYMVQRSHSGKQGKCRTVRLAVDGVCVGEEVCGGIISIKT